MPTNPRPVPQPTRRNRMRPLLAVCLLGTCVALAACGSSGSGASSAAKTSSTSANKAAAPDSSRFAALRSCLQKQGITLPSVPSGAARQPRGPGAPGVGAPGGGAGGFQLPKGVTKEQYQAALKKCGAGNRPLAKAGAFNSASARAGLVKYAACLRQNGINVPAPNTTGKGPVFSTKGIDTSSSKFKAAQSTCQGDLKGAFPGGARGGTPPSGAPNGAPPSGEGAPPVGAGAPPTGEGSAG
jgi:hypothetical protein